MMDSQFPSGLDYFDTLQAENEEIWLSSLVLPPQGFEIMRGMRSIIVFGEDGSGKTALRLSLINSARENKESAAPLIVEWQPGIQADAASEASVAQFMDEILDLTAQTLAQEIAHQPDHYRSASRWAQEALIWLLHRYLRTDPELFLLRLEEVADEAGLNCVKEILTRAPKALLAPAAPYPRQMTEVIQTLKAAGFSGLWVMVDGLESWSIASPPVLGKMLTALFSTLALFDIPGFAVKVMAPSLLKNLVSTSTGLARRRFEIFNLEWSPEMLQLLCERRLALACGQETFHLDALSADPLLLGWLRKFGGSTPRGWLEFLRPLLSAYLQQPLRLPLTMGVTAELQRRSPPRLRMDTAQETVFLGYWAVDDLSPGSLAILRYLYQRPEKACRKEDLYYRGLRGLTDEPPNQNDALWESPKAIEGMVDTALWRLRQVVEPDPKHPIYIVSDRGKGTVRLKNAW